MILKYISLTELNFSKSWLEGLIKIKSLSHFNKYMTIFWLLGPFIYLIERDPADLWLSLISIVFIIRCFKNKDWYWTTQLWFKSALTLWLLGLISALTSPDPFYTFQQGLVWIRFPLYAAAAQVWIAKDRDIRVVMLLSILIGIILMSGILIAETIIDPKTRLSWPYGDLVPGGYLAKVALPCFCVLIAIAVNQQNRVGVFLGMIGLLSIGVSVLTGERTNFLILLCSGILASLIWKPKFIIFSLLVSIEIFAVCFVLFSRPDLSERFTKSLRTNIPILNTSDTNPYWGAWRGGIQQGLDTPLKGIGPSGTRKTCKNLDVNLPNWLPGKNYCGNHPHNFYIQLFAETGILGLISGCLMFISIIISCFRARLEKFDCPMAATAFIVPLALFFPLQQFGSFYGQWGNLFTWFAIAFALSQYQTWRKV